jgi:cyclopropane-fatty-acyl-phospholipid synthase
MVIRHPGALRSLFLSQSERAMGQAYIYDEIDIEGDMESVFPMIEYLKTLRLGAVERARIGAQLLRLPSRNGHSHGRQAVRLQGKVHSIERDRQAVSYHYDTSNNFFALYLVKRMVYSCAYFMDSKEDLDTAQERKLDYICRKLRLREGERLLDIGCGWGGLILHAAKRYGVHALGITLSDQQFKFAGERIKSEGLEDRCSVELRDYRLVDDSVLFDKLVSVGMVEHVGLEMLPAYFAKAWNLLRPGGVFLNHGIGYPMLKGRGDSFSQSYVFPDSEPVSIGTSTRIAEESGFEVRDVECLREHYMLTLRAWVRRLEAYHDEAVKAADEATYRVWRLFMSASAHAFERGIYNVYQSLLVKPDRWKSGLPLTRTDWYS